MSESHDETCSDCDKPLAEGKCLNVDCSTGQENVTTAAGRRTAKQRGTAADTTRRSFNRSGGVD